MTLMKRLEEGLTTIDESLSPGDKKCKIFLEQSSFQPSDYTLNQEEQSVSSILT
jgi:hypothetical protein